MYEEYWKLKYPPFRNTADPRFFYASRQHEEALVKLTYAVKENMGAALLTGPYGCGKTLLSCVVVERIGPRYVAATCGAQPNMTPLDLMRCIARSMTAAEIPAGRSELVVDALAEVLEKRLVENARDGKHTVMILDEAHMIENPAVLETLRLLLNFQNKEGFLLTLLLVGHPELAARVGGLKQLTQRIPISCSLNFFDRTDTGSYVKARLSVAGNTVALFAEDALDLIHQNSGGIPRRINTLCDASLATGFGRRADRIDAALVAEAAEKFGVL